MLRNWQAAWQRESGFLAVMILVGTGILLRVQGLNWDAGALLHADERYLVMVTSALSWPGSFTEYFNSASSPLNPLNLPELNWYVYGTLPLFLAKLLGQVLGALGHLDPAVPGRLLAAVADIGTLVAAFFLGRKMFGYHVGLLGAALYALSVLPVQLAHFFTVDPFLNFFLTIGLLQALRATESRAIVPALVLGLCWGGALSCKLSALTFAPIVAAALLAGARAHGASRCLLRLCVCLVAAFLTFRILQPYAFSGFVRLDPRFLSSLDQLLHLQGEDGWYPPSFQWLGRSGLLYPLENMAAWGMGLLLFATAAGGTARAILLVLRSPRSSLWLPLLWLAILLTVVGLSANPTMRYTLPAYPVLAVLAASFLLSVSLPAQKRLRDHWALILVVTGTLLWALSFSAIYRAPATRVAATEWIFENVPRQAVLGVEYWDDALPVAMPGRSADAYERRVLRLTDPETPAKRDAMLDDLARIDYFIVSSNRGYASLTRMPDQMPLASRFYELLFGGLAGFHLAAEFTSYPGLAGTVIADDSAEEAFTVHDHPRVFVFAKSADFSLAALATALDAVTLPDQPGKRDPHPGSARGLQPVTLDGLQANGNAQVLHLLHWVLLLWLAGYCGNALGDRLWPGAEFPGRTLLLAGGCYLFAVGLSTGAGSGKAGILLLLGGLASATLYLIHSGKGHRPGSRLMLSREATFWGFFLFFLILRAHNPAIAWGERPMDFAILNAFSRTDSLPPVDPWFAGSPLQYHAWGQYFMSTLGRMAGTPQALLYNLAAATIPALAAELFFWLLAQLTAGERKRVWPALAGTLLVLLGGNLYFWADLPGHTDTTFLDFWQASRIIPDTINEFPFWSAVFADLHSHFIGTIFSALLLAGLVLRLGEGAFPASCMLVALALASLALTNVWALPVYAMILILLTLTTSAEGAVKFCIASALLACALALPFWSAPATRVDILLTQVPADAADGMVIFGHFFAVLALWSLYRAPTTGWLILPPAAAVLLAVLIGDLRGLAAGLLLLLLARLYRQPNSRQQEVVGVLALSGVLVILGSEFFTLVDRLNTVFKYQFEAWILLALASAAALAEMSARRILALLCSGLLLLGLPTSLYCLWSWWSNPKVPGQTPTLDGLSWLARDRPGEALATAWLQHLPGQPVLLEAAGPAYGPYARLSAYTGLPTLVGWQYHVWQHGQNHGTILQRQQQVQAAYTSTPGADAAASMGVQYAARCQLEKETYGTDAGDFWNAAGWRPVFRGHDCEIWQTNTNAAQH